MKRWEKAFFEYVGGLNAPYTQDEKDIFEMGYRAALKACFDLGLYEDDRITVEFFSRIADQEVSDE